MCPMQIPLPPARSLLALVLATSWLTASQRPVVAESTLNRDAIQSAINRGITYLEAQQNPASGHWSQADYPALTALPVAAIMRHPERKAATVPVSAARGYDFLLSNQKPDGGIYAKGLATYNTSLALYALTLHPEARSSISDALRDCRRFLIGQQADFDKQGETDSPFDGGVGYGGSYEHSDLSNTHLSLEALYYSQQILEDTPGGPGPYKLDWNAAITFVSRCQNLEGNGMPDMKVTDQNRGGFVYFPGNSKAGEEEKGDTQVALRSYGSMSYAGLLSFIYADLNPTDRRVVAVLDWLAANYTVEENPFMEAQGLFYYFHTMAKALDLAGLDQIPLESGKKANWRSDLAAKLLALQQPDGSWVNTGSKRWWEDDPVLVTSYALLSLEHILQ